MRFAPARDRLTRSACSAAVRSSQRNGFGTCQDSRNHHQQTIEPGQRVLPVRRSGTAARFRHPCRPRSPRAAEPVGVRLAAEWSSQEFLELVQHQDGRRVVLLAPGRHRLTQLRVRPLEARSFAAAAWNSGVLDTQDSDGGTVIGGTASSDFRLRVEPLAGVTGRRSVARSACGDAAREDRASACARLADHFRHRTRAEHRAGERQRQTLMRPVKKSGGARRERWEPDEGQGIAAHCTDARDRGHRRLQGSEAHARSQDEVHREVGVVTCRLLADPRVRAPPGPISLAIAKDRS